MQVSRAATTPHLDRQAQRLHRVVAELVRRYQFRDRNEICCFGISVSQCYALEALGREGELTMSALAARMRLAVSTMTRVVDQLEERGLVRRLPGQDDRRVCCVAPTHEGHRLLARISEGLLSSERAILERVPADQRDSVITAIEELSRAVDAWRGGTTAQGGCCDVG
jgi:MarR family 2-MHQ and catechol resistance regulon transcriptional repressor